MPRVLREVCAGDPCASTVKDASAALFGAVRRVRTPLRLRARCRLARTRREAARVAELSVLISVQESDADPVLRADLPAALTSLARGDAAPYFHHPRALSRLRASEPPFAEAGCDLQRRALARDDVPGGAAALVARVGARDRDRPLSTPISPDSGSDPFAPVRPSRSGGAAAPRSARSGRRPRFPSLCRRRDPTFRCCCCPAATTCGPRSRTRSGRSPRRTRTRSRSRRDSVPPVAWTSRHDLGRARRLTVVRRRQRARPTSVGIRAVRRGDAIARQPRPTRSAPGRVVPRQARLRQVERRRQRNTHRQQEAEVSWSVTSTPQARKPESSRAIASRSCGCDEFRERSSLTRHELRRDQRTIAVLRGAGHG